MSYEPNLNGLTPEQSVIDAQKRMVNAAVKGLPLWQRILKPKNWPTPVKLAVAAGLTAGLKAAGVSGVVIEFLAKLLS